MARAVTMIPPTISLHNAVSLSAPAKRRVCAYARVSTDEEEQKTSYGAQVEYYPRFIREHEGWKFVDLYTDAPDILGLKQNPTKRASL